MFHITATSKGALRELSIVDSAHIRRVVAFINVAIIGAINGAIEWPSYGRRKRSTTRYLLQP